MQALKPADGFESLEKAASPAPANVNEVAPETLLWSLHSLGLGQHIFIVLAVYDSVHLHLSALHPRALFGLRCFGSKGCLLLWAELVSPCMIEFQPAQVCMDTGFAK